MADVNLINVAAMSVTHSYTGVTNGAGALSIDENVATAQQEGPGVGSEIGTPNGNVTKTAISQHTWTKPRTINSIYYKIRTYAQIHGYNGSYLEYHQKIEYTTDGTNWNTVSGTALDGSGNYSGEPGAAQDFTSAATLSVSLANVIGIRAYCSVNVRQNDGHIYGTVWIYEIQAFGQPYDDSGLRFVKGGVVRKIGCETLTASHKLRFSKGGTTYGIPLVATDNSLASPIRIYDGAAVKSLGEVT